MKLGRKLYETAIFLSLTVAAALATVSPSGAMAQSANAALSGIVSDNQSAPIPKATVSIKNDATGVVTNLVTNQDGLYSAPNLIPGSYTVTYGAPTFSSRVEHGVVLTVGATATLNVPLKAGSVTETVEVDGATTAIELTSSQISHAVTGREVRELPLNGRSWTDLVTLEPGVNHITTQQALATGGQTRGNRGFGDEFSIAGARPGQSNYRMDGVSMNDYANNGPGSAIGGNLGVDAIAEFSIISSNYSAEYGKTSGGIVNAISRSGTNQFHGTAYEFIRNSAVDARNFFDPAKIPSFRRNQFGISAGGPIRKGKTFVFGDYEGIRQSKGVSTLLFLPTATARAGTLCPLGGGCTPKTVVVDPQTAKFLPLFPLPSTVLTSSGGDIGTLNLPTSQSAKENFFTIRFDNKFGEKDSAFFSWMFDRTPFTVPDAFNDVINGDYTFRQLFIAEETHTFTSNFVNTVRLGFNWEHSSANTPFGVTTPLAADTSLSGNGKTGPVGVSISGFSTFLGGLGTNNSVFDHWRNYQAYDDASLVRGKHTLKFGASIEILRLGHTNNSNTGKFSFGSIENFLTNKPSTYNGLLPGNPPVPELDMQQAIFGAYLNDDWHLTKNLTINGGLRYEPVTVVSEKFGHISMLRNLTDATPHLGSPFYGNSTLRNFAPRVGLVWDPFGKGTTSIRSGFGVFDYLPLMALWTARQATLAPQTLTGASSDTTALAGTFASGAASKLATSALTAEVTDPQPRASYLMQWNLTVQQQLHPGVTFTVGYVGSHGNHLPVEEESVNLIIPALIQGRYVNLPPNGGGGARPNTHFSKITGQYFNGKSMYNGLLSSLEAQVSRNLTFRGSYTYSKNIDIGSNVAFGDQFANANPSLPFFDLGHLGRGVSDFNVGKTLVLTSLYAFPVGKDLHGVGGIIANGWKLGAIFNMSDGMPFTPTYGSGADPLNSKSTTPVAIPDLDRTVPGCSKNFTNPGNHNHFIKTECFTIPKAPDMAFWTANCDHTTIYGPTGTSAPFPYCFNLYGNAPRNGMQGPQLVTLDMSFYKVTQLHFREGAALEFRIEAFNILNHTNFAPPMTSLGQADIFNAVGTPNSSAGVLSGTSTTNRELQGAVKFTF